MKLLLIAIISLVTSIGFCEIEDKLTLITTTSPVPSNPSTEMLETSQGSLFTIPEFAMCKKIIVFDGVPDKLQAFAEAYEEYKQNVIQLTKAHPHFQNTQLVFCSEHRHLTNAIRDAMEHVDTPYVFIHQHDFKLVKPVDVTNLIKSMEENPDIKHVRLNRLFNRPNRYDRGFEQYTTGTSYVPLCTTQGWSDNDHFSPVSYYKDFVFAKVGRRHLPMEKVLHRLRRWLQQKDAEYAYHAFGTFIYGSHGDSPYLLHLDGKTWKSALEFNHEKEARRSSKLYY